MRSSDPSESSGGQLRPSSSAPGSRNLRRSPVVEIPIRNNGKRKRARGGQAGGRSGRGPKRRRGVSPPGRARDRSGSEELDGVLAEQQLRSEERRSASAEGLVAEEDECATRGSTHECEDEAAVEEGAGAHGGYLPRATTANAVGLEREDAPSLASVREVIESQFNLEIILKHRELRLIEQELAKCQVAYEQLRRCRLVPYPAHSSSQHVPGSGSVNATAGANLRATASEAPWAPAPGVIDGPYARHYAKWLIQDPRFGDAIPQTNVPPQVALPTQAVVETRVTRKAAAETDATAGKGRLRGGPVSSKSNNVPSKKATGKERSGPPILKRSSDGQLVKLVCLDCQRADFSSPQGFINHCRIAHQRGFESHEAAANACGQPVEVDEAGQIIGDADGSGAGPKWLVHPLVRSAPTSGKQIRHMVSAQTIKDANARTNKATDASTARRKSSTRAGPVGRGERDAGPEGGPTSSVTFTPSLQTPHLSAMVHKTGMGIDLASIISEATEKLDLGSSSSSEDDEDEDDSFKDVGSDTAPRRSQHRRPAATNQVIARTVVSAGQAATSSLGTLSSAQTASLSGSVSHQASSNVRKRGSRRQAPASALSNQSSTAADPLNGNNEAVARLVETEQGIVSPTMTIPGSVNLSPSVAPLPTAPSLVTDDDEDDEYEASSHSGTLSSVAGERSTALMDIEVEDGSDGAQQPPRPRPPDLPADVEAGVKPDAPSTTTTTTRGPTTRSRNRRGTVDQSAFAVADHQGELPTPPSSLPVAPPPPPTRLDDSSQPRLTRSATAGRDGTLKASRGR